MNDSPDLSNSLLVDLQSVLDLRDFQMVLRDEERAPQIKATSISISGCPTAGGFILDFTEAEAQIEPEARGRIQQTAVQQMSTPTEMQVAPTYNLLWTAKEAALNTLSTHKAGLLMAQLLIGNWKTIPRKGFAIHTFTVAANSEIIDGLGVAGTVNDKSIALFRFE